VPFRPSSRGRPPVGDSEDLQRILALPRRPVPSHEAQQAMAEEMTRRLQRVRTTPCQCAILRPGISSPCITALLPVQGWYLYEAAQGGGALGHVVVGGGKTGIDILLPMVVPGCKRAVLLIEPKLRKQMALDFTCWSQHFQTPNLVRGAGPFDARLPVLEVLAYSMLSHKQASTWLRAHQPDVLIADEGHNLADKRSVRTDRFIRYFADAEATRLFVHSGSLTSSSLGDYAHLSALSLGEASPLPLDPSVQGEWCECLDPQPASVGLPAPAGALRQMCVTGETARSGFRRRLIETAGVITTAGAELPIRLSIRARDPGPLPPSVRAALKLARAKTRPDGEELVEMSDVAMCVDQIAAGFYYRWVYPRGESEDLIARWFACRQNWNREVRDALDHRSEMLDSPDLLKDAAQRHHSGYRGDLPTWPARNWLPWDAVAASVYHETATVWVDDWLVKDAARWAAEGPPGIVWYGHTAFGERLAQMSGLPLYDGGTHPELDERGDRSIICSIDAHGTGKNLQFVSRMLVCQPPAGGWEQLLGRVHRRGQRADTVSVDVYQHTPELRARVAKALERASYVHETTGKAEKLLYADRSGLPP